MDLKSYCDSVGIELTGWKARLYDVIRKSESLSGSEKKRIAPLLEELHAIVDDLNDRMEYLDRECPADWAADEDRIEGKISELRDKWKEVYGALGETEYGVGGA